MTTKEFIEKAIEGGWKPSRWPEMTKERATEYVFDRYEPTPHSDVLMDPKSWQAVGKVEGWDKMPSGGIWQGKNRWEYNMHQMIDALVEGKSVEQFLETL